MAIKLKTKVTLGAGFLFLLLLLVGIVSFIYLNLLTNQARDILKDNYETLDYTRQLLTELDELQGADSTKAFAQFEQNLQQQEKNITEPGEKELTQSLRTSFNELKYHKKTDTLTHIIRSNISGIMQVNLQAIDRKNQGAKQSAQNAKTIIAVMLMICVLIGFTVAFNFPSLITSPIASLMEGIKGIAHKNYSQRIHLDRKDEFGELAAAFNTMAEQLDKYEHSNLSRILFEKQRAETVINSLKDASIGIDNKGLVLFANQQALQLLNLKEQDIVGLPQKMVQDKNDLFRFLTSQPDSLPFKIVLDGKENYFTREQVEINQQQEKIGTVIIVKNITPFKELDTAKTNFIATISHELKTPLASSDFSLKLLEDQRIGKLTPEQNELVQSLKNDNQRLLRILSELLDMSQVESGKISLNIQAVAAEEMLERAQANVASAAKEKNITIRKESNGNIAPVKADVEKATWVLNNFLTNAIKYAPENSTVVLKLSRHDQFIEIGVSDTGIGIEQEFQSRLFDRYFKVPGTKERKGTGLGLAISKEFVEAMRGKIGVVSQPGKGSYFYFQLPVAGEE